MFLFLPIFVLICWLLAEDVLLSYVGSWPAAGVTVKVTSVERVQGQLISHQQHGELRRNTPRSSPQVLALIVLCWARECCSV